MLFELNRIKRNKALTNSENTQDKELNQNKIKHPIVLSNTDPKAQTSFIRGYKRFWPFLKPHLGMAILGILLTIPVGALDAVIASFLKPFMDNVMIAQEQSFADYVPVVIIAFTLVQGIFIYFSSIVNGHVGGRINLDIKAKLYHKLLDCDTKFYDVNSSGSIIYRFSSDVETASSGLIANIKLFLTKFFSSVSLVCVLLYNSWQLSVVALGVLVVLILPLRIVRKKIKKIISKTVAGGTEIITLYNETTQGSRIIKIFGLKATMNNLFHDKAMFLYRMGMKMIRNTNWLSPVMHLVSSVGVAAVLYFGVHLIITEQLTPGSFVAFLAALIMLYTPIKTIGNNYIQVQQALLALDRIYEILETQSFEENNDEGKQELSKLLHSIEFKDVHFAYDDSKEILKGINLTIRAGQKIALVGNSGGGKSTICSLIPRLYEAQSGQILLDGVDVKDYTLGSLRKNISMVFQDNFLFQGTIRQNILYGKEDASDDEIIEAYKQAYLDDFIQSLPQGLDTIIGERGVSLSGGQKQRLAIARAMIRKAPVVILDEATSALDNKSEKVVQKALDKLMQGKTTIVIAHRLSTIMDADCIFVVNDGLIVEQGTHQELLAKGGAYSALYQSQFKAQEQS